MSVIPFRGRTSRDEIDDLIDRALQDAGDGERWLNPPQPIPASIIYLLSRPARQRQLFTACRSVPADTVARMRWAYREMRRNGCDAIYARHSAIASALVDWEIKP